MKKIVLSLVAALALSTPACAALSFMFLGQGGKSTLNNGLVFYYRMDEVSGNRADATSGAATLVDNNAVLFGVGKIKNAASLDAGSSQWLETAPKVWGFGNNFTISIWYKLTTAAIGQNLFQFGDSMAPNPSLSGCKIVSEYLYCADATGTITKYWSGIPMSTNWTNLMLVNSNGTFTLYQDNVDIGGVLSKNIDDPTVMADDLRPFLVGIARNAGSNSDYYTGLFDEFAGWNRPLTATERTALFNAGAARTAPFTNSP